MARGNMMNCYITTYIPELSYVVEFLKSLVDGGFQKQGCS